MPMHILYAQPHTLRGASEAYFETLIRGIKSLKPDWKLSFLARPEVREGWRNRIGSDCEVFSTPDSLAALYKRIRQLKPDCIHINDAFVKALAAARLARVPRIFLTYHSASANYFYNLKGTFLWKFANRARHLKIIALTESNKNLLVEKRGFSREQVCVIPHGLDPEQLGRRRPNSKSVHDELKLPLETFTLLCPARLAREKAHEVILDALHILENQTSKPVHFLIAGDGPERPYLEDYAKKLKLNGSVHFLGHRNDIPELIQASDVVVLASDYEGLPFAILEAMACEKPVIATRVVGCGDLVTEKTGILIPVRDPKALANAIFWAIEHPEECRQMGRWGKERFLAEFTANIFIHRTAELYEHSRH